MSALFRILNGVDCHVIPIMDARVGPCVGGALALLVATSMMGNVFYWACCSLQSLFLCFPKAIGLLIALYADAAGMGIEVEQTSKSNRRYEELLVSYLDGRKSVLRQRVLSPHPTHEIAPRIDRACNVIEKSRFNGQSFEMAAAHLAPFALQTFDTFRQEGFA
jgi:hypothetical protein